MATCDVTDVDVSLGFSALQEFPHACCIPMKRRLSCNRGQPDALAMLKILYNGATNRKSILARGNSYITYLNCSESDMLKPKYNI